MERKRRTKRANVLSLHSIDGIKNQMSAPLSQPSQPQQLQKQPSSRPAPTRVLRLSPPLEFDVEHACVSADGARLALAGRKKRRRGSGGGGDPGGLDDLYAARVVAVSSGGRPLPGDPASSPSVRVFEAPSSPLASALFSSRPGLRVLQLAWHPLSPAHAVLLTSDSCLRLFHASAADAPAPEQEFELAAALRASGGGGSGPGAASPSRGKASLPLGLRALSLSADASSSSPSPTPSFAAARRASGFAFGPDWSPWERFTVYVQASDGAVFSLCPVAPFGAPLEGSAARALASSVSADAAGGGGSSSSGSSEARAWVQRALPSSPSPSSSILRIRPHALDEHSPALAGPLPLIVPGSGSGSGRGKSGGEKVASTHHLCPPGDAAAGLALLALRPGAIAVLQATASGRIGAAALAGAAAAPAFGSSAPRVAVSTSSSSADGGDFGDFASASAAATAPAVSSVCRAAAPTRGRRLLLLDVVDLSGGGKKSREAAAASFDSEDDGDDEEDDDAFGSKKKSNKFPITMLPDPDDDARVYAVSTATGEAFAVDVDWLPALAARLASSSSGSSLASSSSARGAGGARASPLSSSSLGSTGLPRARARTLRRGPTAMLGARPVGAAAVAAPPGHGGRAHLQRQRRRGQSDGCGRPAVRDGLAHQCRLDRRRHRWQRVGADRFSCRRRESEPRGHAGGLGHGE